MKNPTDADIESMSKQTLLPSREVKIWLEHLEQVDLNCKCGAAKAAEQKPDEFEVEMQRLPDPLLPPLLQQQNTTVVTVGGGMYEEETE